MQTNGTHVTADVWVSEYPAELDKLIERALKQGNCTVLDTVRHNFDGGGFTCLVLLAESHFSVHTFPERNYISLDCYTCGDSANPLDVIGYIVAGLQVAKSAITVLSRG
jgi:S-adenosylmethionine decarboxylase